MSTGPTDIIIDNFVYSKLPPGQNDGGAGGRLRPRMAALVFLWTLGIFSPPGPVGSKVHGVVTA